ncbi:hypothetical protein HanIR_Chr01g0039581 [Helianthus annuus]|nr:hypothetical protein HanIR_Chr01g0039581 [Helianthus annuus]
MSLGLSSIFSIFIKHRKQIRVDISSRPRRRPSRPFHMINQIPIVGSGIVRCRSLVTRRRPPSLRHNNLQIRTTKTRLSRIMSIIHGIKKIGILSTIIIHNRSRCCKQCI